MIISKKQKLTRTIRYSKLRKVIEEENHRTEISYLITSLDNITEIAAILEQLTPIYEDYSHLKPSWNTAKVLFYLEGGIY